MQIAARHQADGLSLLAVTDAPVDEALAFLDEQAPPFPLLADAGAVKAAFGIDVIWGSPTYPVDARGEIVAEEVLGDDELLAARLRR